MPGVCSDQIIKTDGIKAKDNYPENLRRVRFFDKETNKYFVFLTNNFTLPASFIAELYKNRWKIELFFKWIKQHLKIKKFYGNSMNAVKTQIWISISVYVIVAIIKKKYTIEASLYTMLQVLSISLFEKVELTELLNNKPQPIVDDTSNAQICLFDYLNGTDI